MRQLEEMKKSEEEKKKKGKRYQELILTFSSVLLFRRYRGIRRIVKEGKDCIKYI